MHGPTCIFWTNLTPFSPQLWQMVGDIQRLSGDEREWAEQELAACRDLLLGLGQADAGLSAAGLPVMCEDGMEQ